MDFEDRKSSNDIINNAKMSDDEVVASYGPPRSLLHVVVDLSSFMFRTLYFASPRYGNL